MQHDFEGIGRELDILCSNYHNLWAGIRELDREADSLIISVENAGNGMSYSDREKVIYAATQLSEALEEARKMEVDMLEAFSEMDQVVKALRCDTIGNPLYSQYREAARIKRYEEAIYGGMTRDYT